MRHPVGSRFLLSLLLIGTLFGAVGCHPALWMAGATSFELGYLVAALLPTTSVEYICYQDGVEVDCSTLSEFAG
ncbi:MAG: hypothetical protein JSU68_14885 [Phycisphaerales bacterium]|nr:MAG: hypothetical protein JSU68_14885 [Phycisphaerales bacterium]